jgi:hypothetical protein
VHTRSGAAPGKSRILMGWVGWWEANAIDYILGLSGNAV